MWLNLHERIALGLERYNLSIESKSLNRQDFEIEQFLDVEPNQTHYSNYENWPVPHNNPSRAKLAKATWLGDKYPGGFNHYKFLSTIFPETRFITIFRDINEVVASWEIRRLQGTFPPNWDYKEAVRVWNKSIKETIYWQQYLPIQIITYEELILKNKLMQSNLQNFLNLDSNLPELSFIKAPVYSTIEPNHLPEVSDYISNFADFGGYSYLKEYSEKKATSQVTFSSVPLKVAAEKITVDKYCVPDIEIIDYKCWQPAESKFLFRGPKVESNVADSIIFLGSALTFGRYVQSPFPSMIHDYFKLPIINLGIGGARPSTYLNEPWIMDMLAKAKFVVIEAMSARGYSSNIFQPFADWTNMGTDLKDSSGDISSSALKFVDNVYIRNLIEGNAIDIEISKGMVVQKYLRDMKKLSEITHERNLFFCVRSNWNYDKRSPFKEFNSIAGGFPHFVDQQVIDILKLDFTNLLDFEDIPNALDFKNSPLYENEHNPYYASESKHKIIAKYLIEKLEPLLFHTF